eukprot:766317-Hanusia_phi.AAC.1
MPSEHIIMGNSTPVTCSFKFCEGHVTVSVAKCCPLPGPAPRGTTPARPAIAEVTHGSRGRQTPGHCPARLPGRQGCRQEWCNA